MKTFRRDKLRRLIEAGRVVTVSTYHFDDMMGESRGTKVMPVAMTASGPDEWRNRKEGVCYLFPHCLNSKSGVCYESDNGVVTLIVHSNSNYDFRILPEESK